MKQITNKEYEEWQKYKEEKAKGHTRPVIFKIERIDIPETDEGQEWLAKQDFRNTAEDAYTG